jgi:CheY-like chemotaxis protein
MPPDIQAEPLEDLRRVLLVEDDVLLRELVGEAMRDAGLTVVEVANADEARRYLQAAGQADLVYSDVEMPGSMDGIGLGRWIRQTYPDIALILTSGKIAPAAAELGHFIPKPYGVLQAAELARNMVDAKQGDDR